MTGIHANLCFRDFQKEDQKEIRQLILDGLADRFEVVDESLNPDLDDIYANYIDKGNVFVLAELDGRIVGSGALIALGNSVGRMARLSVARGYRRQGIGAALVEHLAEVAKTRRISRLLVETNHDWQEAVDLYRRCGFLPYDHDDECIHLQLDLENG